MDQGEKGLSRQRRWQLARRARGLCEQCGAVAISGMARCKTCHEKVLAYNHRVQGCKRPYQNTKFARAVSADPPEVKD